MVQSVHYTTLGLTEAVIWDISERSSYVNFKMYQRTPT